MSNYSSIDMSKKGEEKKWSEATISIQDHPCQKKTVAAIEQHCALWTDRVRSYFWATASQRCIYATWPSWSWPSMLLEMPAQPLPQPLSTDASRRRSRGARCVAAARGCRIVSGFCSAAQPSVSARRTGHDSEQTYEAVRPCCKRHCCPLFRNLSPSIVQDVLNYC